MRPTPENDAGCRMEPPVSYPSVATAIPAATVAAARPTIRPEHDSYYADSHGMVGGISFDDPIANSSQFSFPKNDRARMLQSGHCRRA